MIGALRGAGIGAVTGIAFGAAGYYVQHTDAITKFANINPQAGVLGNLVGLSKGTAGMISKLYPSFAAGVSAAAPYAELGALSVGTGIELTDLTLTSRWMHGTGTGSRPSPRFSPFITSPGRRKTQFLSTVSEELRLTNVRALGAQRFPPTLLVKHYAIEVSKLARTFGHGLMLEFQTTSWALDVWGDEKWWQFTMTNADAPALLSYMARARLIDLDLEKVLWQANCDAHTERHTAEEWVANQHELLKTKRDEVAAHCAHQLIDKFLETQPRSNSSPS